MTIVLEIAGEGMEGRIRPPPQTVVGMAIAQAVPDKPAPRWEESEGLNGPTPSSTYLSIAQNLSQNLHTSSFIDFSYSDLRVFSEFLTVRP